MSLTRTILTVTAPLALLTIGACATPFKADVARFQAMPAPQGQSFTIRAADARNDGGLEFAQYAGLVSQRLAAQGYRAADDPRQASLLVTIDYGVDDGQQKVVTRPGIGGGFGYGGGFGGPWGWGRRSAFFYGWNDPFWYDPWGYPDISSYTLFTSKLDVTITRAADGQRLFEGKAKARSRTDSLPTLVPNLVEAMFTNFPGSSGEEVRITVPSPPRS